MLNNELEVFMGDFESIKEFTPDGVEIWRASRVMPLYGYSQWQKFNEVIERAMNTFDGTIIRLYEENGLKFDSPASVSQSLFDINLHFLPTTREVHSGRNRIDNYPDYYLTRLACYVVAMNADNRKAQIKMAQQFLALSALENEKRRQQFEIVERSDNRSFITKTDKEFTKTCRNHGAHPATVKSEGDKGFYNNPGGSRCVKNELGIPENRSLYDFMPAETLVYKAMANIDTKYGIINKNLNGTEACAAEAYLQNKAQREHMHNNSHEYPEDTMPVAYIGDARKEMKKINKEATKELTSDTRYLSAPMEDPRILNMTITIAGYTYTLGQWCYLNNADPYYILSLIDSGVNPNEAIYMRPNGKISPIIFFNK